MPFDVFYAKGKTGLFTNFGVCRKGNAQYNIVRPPTMNVSVAIFAGNFFL